MTTSHTTELPDTDAATDRADHFQRGEAPTRVPTGNALDLAEGMFAMLTSGRSPLSVDGTVIGHGLPQREIDLAELRTILLDRDTGYPARDAAWAQLVRRSRQDGPDWTTGCIGVALPGLKAIIGRAVAACDGWSPYNDEVVSALIVGFYDGLRTIDLHRPAIASRLLWQARKAALRVRAKTPNDVVAPDKVGADTAVHRPAEHVDLLLAAAVGQSVLSQFDADLITATRFDSTDPRRLAARLGTSYSALMKRRRRAEFKLAAALVDGGLRDDFEDLMSNPWA